MIGVLIRDPSIERTLELIEQAETAGIRVAWLTTTGAGRDALTLFAAAAVRTQSIKLGTAIIPTWPRHPVAVAQQAQVVEALAPGRLSLGVGPANRGMEQLVGAKWRSPLRHLREYVTVLKSLMQTGEVDFQGEHFSARASIEAPIDVPVLASALLPGAFHTCGEVADGAISWMAPWSYLEAKALPALRAGAASAGRAVPPLIYHVPVCAHEDKSAVVAAARAQVGNYARIPSWAAMFEETGYVTPEGLGDRFYEDYVVSGSESQIQERLQSFLERGASEVIAHPVWVGEPSEAVAATYAAIATANKP